MRGVQNVLRRIHHVRAFSSHEKNYNRSYLDNWVGTSKSTTRQAPNDSSLPPTGSTIGNNHTQQSLQVMGSSYLLPTLRLPRNTSASSMSADLSSFLAGNANSHAMKSMLKPKTASGNVTWRVPIILDLGAFQHDGSPHYKPPPVGFLSSIVSVFDEWGISVMGLTNVQTVENVIDEIADMGLPVLGRVGSGRTLGKKNSIGVDGQNSVGVEELVQLVLKKMDDSSSMGSLSSGTDSSVHEDLELQLDDDYQEEEEDDYDDHGDNAFPKPLRDDILNMSFRELQTECKSLSLVAIGATAVLQARLLEYYEYPGLDENEEEKDADANEYGSQHNISTLPAIDSSVPTKIYHGSVRSGQQVSTDSPNQSLVIMGNVNSGGEVMADGSIYIFGTLRGRALAGLADSEADLEEDIILNDSKIICSHFDAELICIGESFTTIDSMDSIGIKQGSAAMITRDDSGSLTFIGF